MKAVVIDAFGHEDQMRLAEVPTPEPGPSEILIEVAYAGVNPVDWKIRKGFLKDALPHEFPLILGWDAAGRVKAVGRNASRFRVGDAVYAYCRKPVVRWGAYAEYIAVEENFAARAPANIGLAESAGIPLAGLTAWQSLHDTARIRSGESALIHAGAGGVGGMAIQFSKASGAHVLTTASERNHSYVKRLGADLVIDYGRENFAEAVRKHAPDGVDVILDTVGGETLSRSYDLLRRGGRIVSIVDEIDEKETGRRGVQGFYVFVSPNGSELEKITSMIEDRKVKPLATVVLPLEQVAEAHLRSEEKHVQGKLVLKIK